MKLPIILEKNITKGEYLQKKLKELRKRMKLLDPHTLVKAI